MTFCLEAPQPLALQDPSAPRGRSASAPVSGSGHAVGFRVYGEEFVQHVQSMGISEVHTAPRAPWQNPFAERVIGSIRRQCRAHVLILNEAHLRRLLRGYSGYYNTARPHQSLDNNSPQPRVGEPPSRGRLVAIPLVGGLHHRYQRVA